jgi:CubicO group peptidase (beta-lactamase class C family)
VKLKNQLYFLGSSLAFRLIIIIINICVGFSVGATTDKKLSADLDNLPTELNEELSNYFFKNKNPDVRTDSAIVVQDGRIIFEEYREQKYQLHKVWSISKAFTNALVGIAVQDRKLELGSSLCDFYKYLSSNKCKIKISHLLQWSSGFDWSEDYSVSPETSTVLQMLYGNGAADMAKFVIQRLLKFEPGSNWNYSSGDTLLLMGILKKVYGQDYKDLAETRLFRPLGITEIVWEKDESGTLLGASHAFSKIRDLAKFGQLFLNDGLVVPNSSNIGIKVQRLLPLGWVKFSSQVSQAYSDTHLLEPGSWGQRHPAGAGWWVNASMPDKNKGEPWPSVPADTFAARGFRGQYLFVIPQYKMIVVRLGNDQSDSAFDADEMLKITKQLYFHGKIEGVSL